MKNQVIVAFLAASLTICCAQAAALFNAVPISDSGTDNTIAYPNSSRNVAVSADGIVYVVYRNSSSILVARSTNRGKSFETPVQVNNVAAEAEIGVDANGLVYVVWNESSKAWLSISSDEGQSFSTPTEIGAASGPCRLALDAPHVYVTDGFGSVFHNHNNGQGDFLETPVTSESSIEIHVDFRTGDLYLHDSFNTIFLYKSTDNAATFSSANEAGSSINSATTALASTEMDVFLYYSGSGSDALRIDLSDYSATNLTFGTNTNNRGRILVADQFSNVIDGYVDGTEVKYAVSQDDGESFSPAVTVATADYLSLAINPRYGDIVVVYEAGGKIFAAAYDGEIIVTPAVETTAMTEIFGSSAVGGGEVITTGGGTITARGVCWNTTGSPTIADSKTTDGAGVGSFTSELTGLSKNTRYYVRAYATNSSGTNYGNEVQFTTAATDSQAPTVTTVSVTGITATTATVDGIVTDDGGAAITARGVCWSTSANPTIADTVTTEAGTTGEFTSQITGLIADTTYYARAYATNSAGTSYGTDVSFKAGGPELAVSIQIQSTGNSGNAGGDGATAVNVGDDVFVTVSVQNTGTASATGVVITVPIPEGLEFVAAFLSDNNEAGQDAPLDTVIADGAVTLNLADVDPAQAINVDMQFKALAAGEVVFEAAVASDENPTPATAQANTQVDVEDQYWEIRSTLVPVVPCGLLGFSSLLALVGLVAVSSRFSRR